MNNNIKRFNYKYRKRIVARKTIECDPLYLTDLIYTFYSPLNSVIIAEGEFIELTYYMPSKNFKFDRLDNPQEESTQELKNLFPPPTKIF